MDFGLGLILSFTDNATAGINTAMNSLQQLTTTAERSGQTIDTLTNTVVLSSFATITGQLGDTFLELGNSIIDSIMNILGTVSSVGSEFEGFRITLKQLYGDGEVETQIQKLMDYAKKSSYSVADLKDMLVVLKSQGVEAFDELAGATSGYHQNTMDWLGDLMAFKPDVPVERWKLAIQNFLGSGETKMLRNILDAGNIEQIIGHDVSESVEGRMRDLTEIVEKLNLTGLQQEMSKSWDTMASNFDDAWTRIKLAIADTGVFDKLKEIMGSIYSVFTEMDDETLTAFAESIASGLSAILDPAAEVAKALGDILQKVIEFVGEHPELAKVATVFATISAGVLASVGGFLELASSLSGIVLTLTLISTHGGELVTLLTTGFKTIATAVGGVVSVIAGVVTAVTSFVDMWNNGFSLVKEAIMLVGTALTAVGAILLGAPATVAAAVAGIVATIATIAVVVKENWDEICAFVVGIPDWIMTNVVTPVKDFFTNMWNGIVDIVKTVVDKIKEIWQGIVDVVSSVIQAVVDKAKSVWQGIVDIVQTVVDTIVNVWNGLVDAVQSIWDTIKNLVSVAIQAVASVIDAGLQILLLPWTFIWENFGDVLTEKWEQFKQIVSDVLTIIGDTISSVWESITSTLSTVFETLKELFTTAWNAIKDTVSSVLDAIFEVVSTVWESIKETVTTILEAVKETITTAWENIKEAVSNALDIIFETVSSIWESIKEAVSNVLDAIFETVNTIWTSIKETVSSILDAIFETVSNVWNSVKEKVAEVSNNIKESVSTAWNNIKTTISNVVDNIKKAVTDKFNSIKDSVSTTFNNIKEKASSIFNGIKETISNAITKAKEKIKSSLDAIRDYFDGLKLNFPKIKLPHFKITGKFSLDPPQVPKLSIEWYEKGGIFDRPSIIGVGENGKEAVMPLEKNTGWITTLASKISNLMSGGYNTVIDIPDNLIDSLRGLGDSVKSSLMSMSSTLISQWESLPKPDLSEFIPTNSTIGKQISSVMNRQEYITKSNSTQTINHGDNISPVTFSQGSIVINPSNSSEQEAEKFAEMIMEKIKRLKQLENMTNYKNYDDLELLLT